jgi:mono/diheme cytochrome c family protein
MKPLLPFLLVAAATVGVLWRARAPVAPAAASEPLPWTPPLDRTRETGRRIYERYCAWCHGRDRDGFGLNATKLATPPADLTSVSKDAAVHWLADRRPRRAPLCPNWSSTLASQEREALAGYLSAPVRRP